jgi:putative membrane protein
MKMLQNVKGIGHIFIAALIAAAVTGCATSREQPSDANTTANAAATPAARATITTAKAKPPKRAIQSAETSGNATGAAVLSEIHRADLKDIAIGQMAQGKASTDQVREYANQLVKDRTSADQQVIAMAQKKNVRLRDHTSRQGPEPAKLNTLSGPSFDKYFLRQTAADNDKLVRSLRKEREDASDDDIEALIDKILPILEQDQELAQVLMKKEQA